MTLPCRLLMPLVEDALRQGRRVTFTATGSSMRPFLRDGDQVSVEALPPSGPSLGDIVLATDAGATYRLHRVVRIGRNGIFLRGDAQRSTEGPFLPAQLLGRVITPCGIVWRALGLIWIWSAPIGQWLLDLSDRARRFSAIAESCRIRAPRQ